MRANPEFTWKHTIIVCLSMLVGCAIVLAPQFILASSIDGDEFEKAGAGVAALTAVGGFVGVIWKLLQKRDRDE